MKIFLKNNILIFGDSCSGKTFFFKKIKFKKIDFDYFLIYKKNNFKFENFYRLLEKKILKNLKINLINILGGGMIINYQKNFFLNKILIYKNTSLINQKKKLLFDNNNRPSMKNFLYSKIRFCIRKKFFLKLSNLYFKKCFTCNIKIL